MAPSTILYILSTIPRPQIHSQLTVLLSAVYPGGPADSLVDFLGRQCLRVPLHHSLLLIHHACTVATGSRGIPASPCLMGHASISLVGVTICRYNSGHVSHVSATLFKDLALVKRERAKHHQQQQQQ